MKTITVCLRPAAAGAALLCFALGVQAATLLVTSRDAEGVGFNDTTPVDPVGGNAGTTLGEQRMNVYQHVAGLWGAALQSDVTITVSAGWEALSCSSSTAVLGSASSWNFWHGFSGGKTDTWYPQALANKLAGVNLSEGNPDDGTGYGNVDIKTQFNVNLGKQGCLDGSGFYLGLDGNTGGKVNFMTTLLHEIGHGLGFSIGTTNASTGRRVNAAGTAYSETGLPSIWEGFMYDHTLGKTWLETGSSAERKASAINTNKLVWNGAITVGEAAETLAYPPSLQISSPAQQMGTFFAYGTASFGAALSTPMNLGLVADTASQACAAFAADSLRGRVAIVDRGSCNFAAKAKAVQEAGGVGAIIVNNAAGSAPGLGGSDSTVVIPTVSLSQADGATLRSMVSAAVKYGSRKMPGLVNAATAFDTSGNKAGADASGRPLLYTPNPYSGGSSVSHWDVSAYPNLLMEPFISADLTTQLSKPYDLTLPLLKDLGW